MQYLPPVTQPCIVVCYESFRFQVHNSIVGLERAQDRPRNERIILEIMLNFY